MILFPVLPFVLNHFKFKYQYGYFHSNERGVLFRVLVKRNISIIVHFNFKYRSDTHPVQFVSSTIRPNSHVQTRTFCPIFSTTDSNSLEYRKSVKSSTTIFSTSHFSSTVSSALHYSILTYIQIGIELSVKYTLHVYEMR